MRSIEYLRNRLLQVEKKIQNAQNMDLPLSSGGYETRRVRQQLDRSIKNLRKEEDRLKKELLECEKNLRDQHLKESEKNEL